MQWQTRQICIFIAGQSQLTTEDGQNPLMDLALMIGDPEAGKDKEIARDEIVERRPAKRDINRNGSYEDFMAAFGGGGGFLPPK